ncbi:MAG: flagellar FlbD family protein [Acidimicrobiia bacterium]|nr:flagellar FlbD family protein [Acidimicrobiia bacterium]MDX2467415.1 flagellar FlbD family protein [Acidimicrobiia bacterium]
MIPVTPIAGRTVLLNANLIEAIEETPDTVIVLAGGRRMVVVDVPDHLVARIERIRASVFAAAHNRRPRGRGKLYAIEGGEE